MLNISISESKKIEEFDEYMFRLQPKSNVRNPWFGEYWHKLTDCHSGGNMTPQCQQVNMGREGRRILVNITEPGTEESFWDVFRCQLNLLFSYLS